MVCESLLFLGFFEERRNQAVVFNLPKMIQKILTNSRVSILRRDRKKKQRIMILALIGILLGLISISVMLLLNKKVGVSLLSFFVVIGLFFVYIYFRNKLRESSTKEKMEDAFPDFLSLMASNLRAGMTIDKALLLSSRPEFHPLDDEIMNVGKDISTGRSLKNALLDMATRIKSEKIRKTVLLILSGIQAGGNISVLIEETATNMREKSFVEKKAASTVLMYLIFIFVAATVGAPVLFSLSTLLVETLSIVLSSIPPMESTTISMPFSFSEVSISVNFIIYFSLVFIIVTNILASRIIGLVAKGDEKGGIKYILPMLAISIGLFMTIRIFLRGYIHSLFV
jgi:archaeal flagellar protein FlaJ